MALRLRRDTAAAWTANNPILVAGQLGYETDTRKFKFGDGVTAWNALAYAGGGGGGAITSGDVTTALGYTPTSITGYTGVKSTAQIKTALAITKGDVGLGNVDNTSDVNKPVSTAQQAAIDLKANIASPVFTGVPAAPTPTVGDNTTKVATTAFVIAQIAALINSAPGALDTLDELAAALGDDPNFATTVTNALATKQPLDSDLTAIAALTTQAFGRGLLEGADAAAVRTLLGLVIGTDVQAYDADLAAIAALATTAFGRSLLTQADAAAVKTLLGLVIGTDVQAYDADLAAIAAIATTAYGRGLLTLADQAALQAAVGVSGGVWTQIGATQTPTGANATFSTIPNTYQDLMVELDGISHNSGSTQTIRIEYSHGGVSFSSPVILGVSQIATSAVYGSFIIAAYNHSVGHANGMVSAIGSDPGTVNQSASLAHAWRCGSGIDTIRLSPGSGVFDAGTIKLFGR